VVKRRSLLVLLPALLVAPGGLCAPPETDFSGSWKQSNERSTPPRSGDVTLRITTDGRTSISTSTDGDEFHTSVVWNGRDLVFSIEEHEEG
jgi:hypothetical protein